MNREEEYRALEKELENLPESLETVVQRAAARKKNLQKKRRVFGIPAASLAACFAGFVLLVNLFPPFAYACGGVPLLRKLAKAVAWSPSLLAAVENEYVQPIDQSKTVNGITPRSNMSSWIRNRSIFSLRWTEITTISPRKCRNFLRSRSAP